MTMIRERRWLPATFLTIVAASLASVMFTSYASAQCLECDEYPNRDPFTQGLATPPANQPGTPSARNAYRNPYGAYAQSPRHRGDHWLNPYREYP